MYMGIVPSFSPINAGVALIFIFAVHFCGSQTTLATSVAGAMKLEYNRVQFTPDVLPTDITGFSVYRSETRQMVFQPGAAMCNLLLADERSQFGSAGFR